MTAGDDKLVQLTNIDNYDFSFADCEHFPGR